MNKLKLANININFDRTLVTNGEIEINDGEMVVIYGDSGCGKTSVLYMIGLISQFDDYTYIFDGDELDLNNDRLLGVYRKQKIGYIFQDNNLLTNLTVEENLRFSAKVAGKDLKSEEIEDILREIDLSKANKKYPNQLSGGEKQRVAVMTALVKDPSIIIADEPTSALDEKNTAIIIKMLSDFVAKGKKVVIATHDSRIAKAATTVYEICDERIVKLANNDNREPVIGNKQACVPEKRHMFSTLLNYIRRSNGKNGVTTSLMIFLCALTIAMGGLLNSFGNAYLGEQKTYLNKISNREVFAVNLTAPISSVSDIDDNLSMTDVEVGKISLISEIQKIYPYIELRSDGYDGIGDRGVSNTTMTVSIASGENSEEQFADSYNKECSSYTVVAYYDEQNLANLTKCEFETDAENKIYISSALARALDIVGTEGKVSITCDLGIPVGTYDVELVLNNSDVTCAGDSDIAIFKTYDFEIAGILTDDTYNRYSNRDDNMIYIPYDMLTHIIDEVKESGYTLAFDVNPFSSSAYVIFVKDYNQIEAVKSKVSSINPNFKTISTYQDIDSMNDMLDEGKQIMTIVFYAVLLIIFLLMVVIQVNRVVSRKYEIALLRANGLNNGEILLLVIMEALITCIKIVVVSLLFAWIITNVFNNLFGFTLLEISWLVVFYIVVISLVAVSIPAVVTILYFNRYKPAVVLRD